MTRVYTLLIAVITLLLMIVASQRNVDGMPARSTESNGGPGIKFSHKFHVETEAGDCVLCHENAPGSKFSSDNLLPAKAACAACHDVEDETLCAQCHEDEQSYAPFMAREREVLFSHDTHIAQGMECATCHRGIADDNLKTSMPDMTTCNTCHNDRQLTNTCESCHLDFASLLPDDHKVAEFKRNHRFSSRIGELQASCQTCHKETFCQDCHTDGGLKSFGKSDRSTDPRPKLSTTDRPDRLLLQSVHELNYRFTHGIDARSKAMDCSSCHETQSFCVQCHEAGGNVTQGVFRPSYHDQPGFTTIGRGSGGGLHAVEARRDMESCISCHDVEGRDPTCFTCHTEDGIIR